MNKLGRHLTPRAGSSTDAHSTALYRRSLYTDELTLVFQFTHPEVISCFLFYVAIKGPHTELPQIPDFYFYAGDIILWTTQGSDDPIQDTVQQGLALAETYL